MTSIGSFVVIGAWLVIRTRRHPSEDCELLSLFRSVVFRQMRDPLWDGRNTIIEGRRMTGAEHRLESLGLKRAKNVHWK